jgi:hypothetical protein
MHIDLLVFPRMELHNGLGVGPKLLLDHVHLVPYRAPVRMRNRYVLPRPTWAIKIGSAR